MFEESTVSLTISRVHFPVTTLGPGKRIGVWFQGCGIQCPGCISKDTWARKPANTTVSEVLEICSEHRRDADGLTITGGEPLEQMPGSSPSFRASDVSWALERMYSSTRDVPRRKSYRSSHHGPDSWTR